jgi:hypothetical protein
VDEKAWATCGDPYKMLAFLQGSSLLTDRKGRLYASAVCRRIWHLITQESSKRVVEVAERQADGLATTQELFTAFSLAETAWGAAAYGADAAASTAGTNVVVTTSLAADAVMYATEESTENERAAEEVEQCYLIRDIFANPFRLPPPLGASLLTSKDGLVRRLADEAYEHRLLPSGQLDSLRLNVLADALEEAGADAEMVEHLRGPRPHWRGCWWVDVLTGRE